MIAVALAPDALAAAWTRDDVALYEDVRDREKDAGRSHDRAEHIARRAVEDLRRAEGRAPAEPDPEPAGPNDRLEEQTRDELYDRAKELGIGGRSRMTKEELMAAIRAQAK